MYSLSVAKQACERDRFCLLSPVPQVEHTVEAYWNESVTLPCYLDIPRNQSPNDLRVWWEEANNTIFEKQEDTV